MAETGVYAVLSNAFPKKLGKVIAAAEVVTGAGSMLGPFVGGNIFDALASVPSAQFGLTFLVVGMMPLLAIALVWWRMPQSYIGEEEEKAPLATVLSFDIVMTSVVTFMGAAAMNGRNELND